jgi:hypothetical protein
MFSRANLQEATQSRHLTNTPTPPNRDLFACTPYIFYRTNEFFGRRERHSELLY